MNETIILPSIATAAVAIAIGATGGTIAPSIAAAIAIGAAGGLCVSMLAAFVEKWLAHRRARKKVWSNLETAVIAAASECIISHGGIKIQAGTITADKIAAGSTSAAIAAAYDPWLPQPPGQQHDAHVEAWNTSRAITYARDHLGKDLAGYEGLL